MRREQQYFISSRVYQLTVVHENMHPSSAYNRKSVERIGRPRSWGFDHLGRSHRHVAPKSRDQRIWGPMTVAVDIVRPSDGTILVLLKFLPLPWALGRDDRAQFVSAIGRVHLIGCGLGMKGHFGIGHASVSVMRDSKVLEVIGGIGDRRCVLGGFHREHPHRGIQSEAVPIMFDIRRRTRPIRGPDARGSIYAAIVVRFTATTSEISHGVRPHGLFGSHIGDLGLVEQVDELELLRYPGGCLGASSVDRVAFHPPEGKTLPREVMGGIKPNMALWGTSRKVKKGERL